MRVSEGQSRTTEQIQGCSDRDDLHMSAVNKTTLTCGLRGLFLVGYAEDFFLLALLLLISLCANLNK